MTDPVARIFQLLIELDEAGVFLGNDGVRLYVVSQTHEKVPARLEARIAALSVDLIREMAYLTPMEAQWLAQYR